MLLEKKTIQIGLEKPVRVLHVGDSHFCFADERDNERKQALAAARERIFRGEGGRIQACLNEMIDYANEHCDLLVHTGDLCDFVSQKNLEMARAALQRCKNGFFIAGNHEFSQYVGEAYEDTTYKMTSHQQVRPALGVDLLFNTKQVGGINFVGIDDSYYRVEDWQTQRLMREVQKGLPIVLVMHVPVFEQALYTQTMQTHECAYLLGCDENHLLPYPEFRAVQQRPTPETMRFIEYIQAQPLIRAVLAGHVHAPFFSLLPGGKAQSVAGAGYKGMASEVEFV